MNTSIRSTAFVVVWGMVIASFPCRCIQACEKSESRSGDVRACDLMETASDGSRRMRVIGDLGHPLGKLITISGYWRQDSNPCLGLQFHVISVNGVSVGDGVSGITFDEENVKPDGLGVSSRVPCKEWDMWRLRGYESGAFRGYNSSIFQERDAIVIPHPSFAFRREFVYYRCETVRITLPPELEALRNAELAPPKKTAADRPGDSTLAQALNAALAWRKKGRFSESLVILNRAIEEHPKSAEAFASRGAHFFALSEPTNAMADFRRAMKLNPQCSFAHAGVGGVRLFEGDHDGAIVELTRAIDSDGRSAQVLYARGAARYMAREYDAALADLNQAIDLDGSLDTAYCYRSIVLLALNAPESANRDLDAALRIGGEKAHVFWIRSFINEKLQRHEQASLDRKRAVAIDAFYRDNRGINDGLDILGRRWTVRHPNDAISK